MIKYVWSTLLKNKQYGLLFRLYSVACFVNNYSFLNVLFLSIHLCHVIELYDEILKTFYF